MDANHTSAKSAASHNSSDLGQLSNHSNQLPQDGDGDRVRPSSSSNVIASLLLSGKSIDNQRDHDDFDGPGLGLGD